MHIINYIIFFLVKWNLLIYFLTHHFDGAMPDHGDFFCCCFFFLTYLLTTDDKLSRLSGFHFSLVTHKCLGYQMSDEILIILARTWRSNWPSKWLQLHSCAKTAHLQTVTGEIRKINKWSLLQNTTKQNTLADKIS